MSRRTVANLVWFGLIATLFIVWAARNILPLDVVNRPYTIKAEFGSSIGMQPGNEVAYLGVTYGAVSGIKRVPDGVLVTMKIDREKKIPAGASAHLFRKSAIGEQYVDLAPPAGLGSTITKPMHAGDLIPRSRTTTPLEFSELLRSASRVIGGIPPEDVHTLVHELAIGLDGRTDSLRQLAEAGDRLGQTLAARTETLDRLATNNTRLTHVVTEHRGSLGQSLTDLEQVAAALQESKGDLARLLDVGAPFLQKTADLVAGAKGNLDCTLKDLEVLTDETSTDERLAQTRSLIETAPRAFDGVFSTRDVEPDGVWVRVGFLANVENKAPQFVPPRPTPTVKQTPACASPLRPVSSTTVFRDYAPASASHEAPLLPGPWRTALLLAVLLGASAATVLRISTGVRSR